MMEELIFLVHRIPYPPNKGDKIRSYHLLKHLAKTYRIHLGAFVDDPDDWRYAQEIAEIVTGSIKLLPITPNTAKLRSLTGLLTGKPLTLPYYQNNQLQTWVDELMATHTISTAVVFSSAMAQFIEPYPQLQRIIDFVDIDSDKWQQYAAKKSWPMKQVYQREARMLFNYERRIAASFAAATFVSSSEANLFTQLAPECASRVHYFNNGVDLNYFSATHHYDNPYPTGKQILVFTGAMDYWANADAVSWFAHEVFPALLDQFPDLLFYIVGSRPLAQVLALQTDSIFVTGTVKDVRPYLACANISVAPLRIARGIQNKVLEAMAMSMAVIVSPQALEGINATINDELILAIDAAAFKTRIAMQLSQPNPALGLAARQRVEQSYSWNNSLRSVDLLLTRPFNQIPQPA
jgi:sugar transferase (PEP-CTERM/EpsH1 system associated)